MDPLIPEQVNQLANWVIQRDALLSEISVLKTEKEKKEKEVKELAQSKTTIENEIQQAIGRMAELDKQEELYKEIVAIEIPKLEIQKTTLETEIMGFQKEVSYLDLKKEGLLRDIEFLISTKENIFDKTSGLGKVVEHVTSVNSLNMKELEESVKTVKVKVDEILKVSTDNISSHTRILNEIPALFVELQRKSLTREKL